ncbi:MAG: transporter substrate-binding domain-containing protein [Pseudomonadota bacterium]
MRVLVATLCALLALPGVATSSTLDHIKSEGKMTFGLEAQYKPFEFRDENNEIIGYDIDVATEIGKRLGDVAPDPIDTNWSTVIQSLYNGDFDLILGGMTATAERYKRVNFSYPYMDASSGLLVKKDSGITSPADLAGKSVGAGAGTPQIKQLELAAEENGISYNGATKTYDADTVAYAAMNAGRIDAYASTLVSLLAYAQTDDSVTVIPFTSNKWDAEYTAMAFRKEDEDLQGAINEIIVEMKDDGTLAALQEKWFGQSFVDILPNKAPTFE